MMDTDLVELELRLLLQGILEQYGYDFRGYSLESLKRRVGAQLQDEGLGTISALQERALRDHDCMQRLLVALAAPATRLFRDPGFYDAFRKLAVPRLRTYPFLRFWLAGCASGEEAYSLAILMREAGLLERCRIYATDMNEALLEQARRGAYPQADVQASEAAYRQAGGMEALESAFVADGDVATALPELRQRIVFEHHNLVTDASFNEFHVVWCRNVLVYFDKPLQNRVYELLDASLGRFGYLGLGERETLSFTPIAERYETLAPQEKLYRKVA
jgi:chemotaxis protein methyltransferase CheR